MADRRRPSKSDRRRRRGRAFRAIGGRVVGPARQDGAAAQVQPGPARLHPRRGLPQFRAAIRSARQPSRACASSTSAAAAALLSRADGAARRRGRGRRSGRAATSRRRAACRAGSGLAIDYRDHHRRGAGGRRRALRRRARMEVVEHVADRGAVRATLRRDGEARRPDDRGDAQPHAEELSRWPSSAPNTCCAGCRAAPITGTSS